MYQQSILIYRHFRFLKLALLLLLAVIAAYVIDQPMGPANGGTVLGYILGGLGSILILLLMWLGVRKRHYSSRMGTVQGWVSAHIYLGLALVFVVTFHAGFQFGFNIHTLSYLLMLLVVGSGLYGVYVYLRYPQQLSANNAGMSRAQMLRDIVELHQECLLLSEKLSPEIHHILTRDIATTQVGGGLWRQIKPFCATRRRGVFARFKRRPAEFQAEENLAYDATMYLVADHMAQTHDEAMQECLRRILELWGRRNALLKRLKDNVRYQTLLEIWLYVHVPLSFALLAAVIVHVVTVFLYW